MDPINYSQDVATPFQALLQGYQGGAAIRNDQTQQQQQQAALALQKQQQLLLNDLAQKQRNGTATADDFSSVMTQIPAVAEQLNKAWSVRNPAQQQAHAADLQQWGAAIQAGQPEVAVDAMNVRADAMEKQAGGPTQDSQALRVNAQTVQAHPELALGKIQAMLSVNPNGKQAADALAAFGAEKRAQDQAPAALRTANANATIKQAEAAVAPQAEAQKLQTGVWNNANIRSQIENRAAQLGLDKDKLTTDTQLKLTELNQKFGQLPDDARSLVNSSTLSAVSSEQQVQQYQQLAGQIDALGGSWGAGSTAHEWLKRATGSEDAVSALKREYTRMASQGVIKLLPPGPASDKDIANAKEGIPNANASPEVMASYLRGMSKLSAYDAVLNNAKAEWAGSVKHLGRTPADIIIDGVKVPAGTTFNEFARGYLVDKAKALDAASQVSTRGYMRFAQPATAAPATETPVLGD